MGKGEVAAFAPLVLIAVVFVAGCLIDLVRRPRVRHMPKWAWALVCVASIPLGGVLYLLVGREHS
ncbi:PLDc_N domain-containing protein [Actinomadura rubrisoli]|uniref:PLDc_N domain-containing protein n=1 Tax=Actinomadura rubrisoli TaxID=2530368 RepID=A0A4R4ZT23_9ACTN|nr:PLDc_N domain-containing protein [Actinomadura rubrisoli]